MTDQRDTPDPGKFFGALAPTRTLSNADTPDTRTPRAELRWSVRCATCGDAIAYYGKARGWRHAFDSKSPLDHPATPTEGGASEAPSSRRASDRSPMLSTADRDALVDRLRGFSRSDRVSTIWTDRAAAALEDLTRENERLNAYIARRQFGGPDVLDRACAAERQVAALDELRTLADRATAEGNTSIWPDLILAALDTASEDRGDSRGAVRNG